MGKRMCSGGFTLMEVLVAVAVFAFAVLGLLFALNVTTDAARETLRQQALRAELQNRLARLSVPPYNEGRQTEETGGIRYTSEVAREPIKAADLTLMDGYWRIRVLAEWKENGKNYEWDVSHLAFNAKQ
ncbi:MAG: prepilin-type N-terminal cleavage/methylation domain-containing protein [Verrucomicrobia bacterium]|nr:prepilin-type N-terminal cleavage/methylation domain-containing protein [Verrucomicrobiota bacterium]